MDAIISQRSYIQNALFNRSWR